LLFKPKIITSNAESYSKYTKKIFDFNAKKTESYPEKKKIREII